MAFTYTIEGIGSNIAIKRYKGYKPDGLPVKLYKGFYDLVMSCSHNELLIFLYLIDNMNIGNEVVIDSIAIEDLGLVLGRNEEPLPKPAEYRYPYERVMSYLADLKARKDLMTVKEKGGKTYFINPKVCYKGTKQQRKYFMTLYQSFLNMRKYIPNCAFDIDSIRKYTRTLEDIRAQQAIDGNYKNTTVRIAEANGVYKKAWLIDKAPKKLRYK